VPTAIVCFVVMAMEKFLRFVVTDKVELNDNNNILNNGKVQLFNLCFIQLPY